MAKKILSLILGITLTLCTFASHSVLADDISRARIEEIIAGNQDYLVLASITEKGASAYEVQIFEEIGADPEALSDAKKDAHILVRGFDKYTYYDNYPYRPQKGDNVLLSLNFNGNSYSIKNGAYRVDFTSHEQCNFLVPESLNGSEEALELNALHIFIHSNGQVKDHVIRNGAIYGKDSNGEEKKLDITGGVKFIDEFGDTSEKPTALEMYGQNEHTPAESRWQLVALILVLGMGLGVFVVSLARKFEKRYEEK